VLGAIPTREGVNGGLELGRKGEVPAVFEKRIGRPGRFGKDVRGETCRGRKCLGVGRLRQVGLIRLDQTVVVSLQAPDSGFGATPLTSRKAAGPSS
jgi:hypothetical protein